MRTSALTVAEQAAFNKFAQDFDIITEGAVGIQNASLLCESIINSETNPTITAQTLAASLLKVKNQIRFMSKTYKAADALARQMSAAEQEIYRQWAARQKQLIGIDGSEEGYKNVESLLSWMRESSVTARGLDIALGNLLNNPQPGQRIYFHPRPPQQDRSVVGGKPNHAFGEQPKAAAAGAQQEFHPNGRRNHSYVDPAADAAKQVTAAPRDAWAEIIQMQLKDWTLPSQEARLQNEYAAGVKAGKSDRDISSSLQAIIRDRQRGR
jgi:hypothetical protein